MQANSSEKEQARGKQKDAAQSQDKVVTTKQRNLRGVDERCPKPIIGGWFAFPYESPQGVKRERKSITGEKVFGAAQVSTLVRIVDELTSKIRCQL